MCVSASKCVSCGFFFDSFSCLGVFVLLWLVCFYLILLLEVCLFSKRDRKGMGPDGRGGGEELGGVDGGGGIVIKIHYVRENKIYFH